MQLIEEMEHYLKEMTSGIAKLEFHQIDFHELERNLEEFLLDMAFHATDTGREDCFYSFKVRLGLDYYAVRSADDENKRKIKEKLIEMVNSHTIKNVQPFLGTFVKPYESRIRDLCNGETKKNIYAPKNDQEDILRNVKKIAVMMIEKEFGEIKKDYYLELFRITTALRDNTYSYLYHATSKSSEVTTLVLWLSEKRINETIEDEKEREKVFCYLKKWYNNHSETFIENKKVNFDNIEPLTYLLNKEKKQIIKDRFSKHYENLFDQIKKADNLTYYGKIKKIEKMIMELKKYLERMK